MNADESNKTPIKTEKRNRNEENRRQIIDFIADNVISDAKTISKAIELKPSRTRDFLKQLGLSKKISSPVVSFPINSYLCDFFSKPKEYQLNH